ncbi:MAG TPA: 50S ribosomal protein L2 [Spirochaetes bacterium]|nr:50S ribosomal protein L2 [Spirochaetota bacterium]
MAIKKYKPITPSRRYYSVVTRDDITEDKPYKPLTEGKKRISGRNNSGRITTRRRGGGAKKLYRKIDFKRDKRDIEAKVESIEYDPNRSARIALVCYPDGERRYILMPDTLKVGDRVIAGEKVRVAVGNAMPIGNIPLGSILHNVELYPGKGGQIARSAGSFVQLAGKEGKDCIIKLPSSETRIINEKCYATIGQIGNQDHFNVSLGKAGRSRWLGRRPKVRGVAMNPVDHPHGGGEGRTSGGRHPVSPWGVPTKGYKTRKKNKPSDKYIVSRRKKKK